MRGYLKRIVSISATLAFCTSCGAPEMNALDNQSDIAVRLNGAELEFSAKPVNIDGSIYVPMRVIFEAMGRSVTWNDEEKSATATDSGGSFVSVSVGSDEMKFSEGDSKKLSNAPIIENSSTLIPVRAISEALGAQVDWSEESQTVDISYKTEADISFKSGDYEPEWEGAAEKLDISQPCEITSSGIYEISGKSDSASITVNVDNTADAENIYLVLNGAELSSESGTPINIISGEKVVLVLASETENFVSGAAEGNADSNITAAIFSKCNLSITGSGKLTVNALYNDGITSRDKLRITGGEISVTAVGDAIVGRDAFAVENAHITVDAGKDGIRTTNTSDTSGDMYIGSGSVIDITSGGDGISAEGTVQIDGGTVFAVTGGGYSEDIRHESEFSGGFEMGRGERTMRENGDMPQRSGGKFEMPSGEMPERSGGRFEMPSGEMPEMSNEQRPQIPSQADGQVSAEDSTQEDEISKKGIKSSGNIVINDGNITVSSYDDSIHSGGGTVIAGAVMTLEAGDDGIHSDSYICIDGGEVNIKNSYEGIEAYFITVSDGKTSVNSTDDALNVNSSTGKFLIEGGNNYFKAGGDGADSNNALIVTGGYTVIDGPENNGNGAIDAEREITITGGTLIAAGSSGMAMQPGSTSTQASFMVAYENTIAAGTKVDVVNSDGEVIMTVTPSKSFQTIVFSCAAYVLSEEYTVITNGEETVTFTPDIINAYVTKDGVTEARAGFGGFGRGGRQHGDYGTY